ALRPTRWAEGGAISTASPAPNPIRAPSSGPPVRASATTSTSTRFGGEPPGNGRLSSRITCSRTAAGTATTASSIRRITAWLPGSRALGGSRGGPRACGGPQAWGGPRACGRAGAGRGAGVGGGGGRAGWRGWQHRVARVVPRRRDHHADHAEGAVVGE